MMLVEFLKSVVVQSFQVTPVAGANGAVVFTSTGDKFAYTAVAPVRLLKWGFIADAVAVAQTASAMKLTLFNIPFTAAGGGSGGGTAVDTLTTGAGAAGAFPLGTGAYRDGFTVSTTSAAIISEVPAAGPIGVVTPNIVTSGQQQLQLSTGGQWVINVTTASDNTGQGKVWIEYVLLPIAKPSGYGFGATSPDGVVAGSVSLTDNFTRLAS